MHQHSVTEPKVLLRLLAPHPEARNMEAGTARTGRALALLTFLYLGPPETTRDELCELLWDPEPGHDSQHRLRELLSSTRRFLPEGTIVTAGRSVSVNRDAIECDVVLFRRAATSGRPSEAALLYQADFLVGGVPSGASLFSEWADSIARGLREELAAVLRQSIGMYEESGDLMAASTAAGRLWRMDQDDEEVATLFVTLSKRAGDGVAALATAADVEAHWIGMGGCMPAPISAAIEGARAHCSGAVWDGTGDPMPSASEGGIVPFEESAPLAPSATHQTKAKGEQSGSRRRRGFLGLTFTGLVAVSLSALFPRDHSLAPTDLLVPAHGSSVVSTSPTFVWTAVEGANRYWLLVATTPEALPDERNANSCSGCVVSGSTDRTSHSLPDPFPITPGGGFHPSLKSGRTYYWKVLAWNTAGPHPSGRYSDTWVFRTGEAMSGR